MGKGRECAQIVGLTRMHHSVIVPYDGSWPAVDHQPNGTDVAPTGVSYYGVSDSSFCYVAPVNETSRRTMAMNSKRLGIGILKGLYDLTVKY